MKLEGGNNTSSKAHFVQKFWADALAVQTLSYFWWQMMVKSYDLHI